MVRLVFRPYTQIRRTICTSVSLRTSTRVSSGFILFRHSSPSFGSQHRCSCSIPSAQGLRIGRWCLGCYPDSHHSPPTRAFTFIPHPGFATRLLACVLDSLVRVSRRVGENRSLLTPVSVAGAPGCPEPQPPPPLSPADTARQSRTVSETFAALRPRPVARARTISLGLFPSLSLSWHCFLVRTITA